MEIDITSLLELDAWELSHSAAEGGWTSARDCWQASQLAAEEHCLLDSDDKLQAMREFARSSGGWTKAEIDRWTPTEINALFLQWVAGDIRQLGADSLDEIDWVKAEGLQGEGLAPSNMYKGDNGRVYYYLGS
jgi:hypothetical protein